MTTECNDGLDHLALDVAIVLRDMAQNMGSYGLRTKRGNILRAADEIERQRALLTNVVDEKQAAEKECIRLQGLLAGAYASIRRQSQKHEV
jgi:hypothetical protein